MPLYINPDFRRLPSGPADPFGAARDSFFQLPAWYDLVARYGVLPGTETRVYTDERAGSATAVVLQSPGGTARRRLESLTNAHSLEHGILRGSGGDLGIGLAAILSEILGEGPPWDCPGFCSRADPVGRRAAGIAPRHLLSRRHPGGGAVLDRMARPRVHLQAGARQAL